VSTSGFGGSALPFVFVCGRGSAGFAATLPSTAPLLTRRWLSEGCRRSRPANSGDRWIFRKGQREETVRVKARLTSNNGQALRNAALAGLGIVMQGEVLLADDIAAGRLVPVLPDWEAPSRPMHIVFLPDRRPLPKVRVFIDFVVARFG
jgi:DNA-binding transcriptional LysR family regulator